MKQVILLSGHTGNGKSRLAEGLQNQYGFEIMKTSILLSMKARELGLPRDRQSLKDLGDKLDDETDHCWLIEAVKQRLADSDSNTPIVVDSIRKAKQLKLFRDQLDFKVTHVHLYASKEALQKWFEERQCKRADVKGPKKYPDIDLIKTPEDIKYFKDDADVRIFTERTKAPDTLVRVAAYLRLYPSPDFQCVDVLVGGQYGSEGKGQVAAYLAQEYDVLMRVGGPNAGHKVARERGKYTYHSLPSGSRESNADVLIGPGATIHIEELLSEIDDCEILSERLYIDPQVMVITDKDRAQEGAMKDAIGSTGRGGGAAASRRIMERLDHKNRAKLAGDYAELEPYIKSTHERLQRAYSNGESVLLEGTQGSALSLYHGPYPYVTSRDTNVSGCLAEAGIPPRRIRRVLMVIRYTPIRVQSPKDGDSGQLKHETDFETVQKEAGLKIDIKTHERTSTTNKERRVGWFEWDSYRKACELNAPTDIVLTFADYHKAINQKARRFEQLDNDTIKFVEELERIAQAPVSLINTRFPHEEDDPRDLRTLIDRRDWRTISSTEVSA